MADAREELRPSRITGDGETRTPYFCEIQKERLMTLNNHDADKASIDCGAHEGAIISADGIAGRSTYNIKCADVHDGLESLAANSVQCVVTSPPYWALRDYGVEGQLGHERTPAEYVEALVAV